MLDHGQSIRVGHDVWSRALSPVASLSRKKAGYQEWAALSEELGDLQASPDEEIRRLTELFRTGYLQARDDRTSKKDRVSRM